jgi:hypothetical protein
MTDLLMDELQLYDALDAADPATVVAIGADRWPDVPHLIAAACLQAFSMSKCSPQPMMSAAAYALVMGAAQQIEDNRAASAPGRSELRMGAGL